MHRHSTAVAFFVYISGGATPLLQISTLAITTVFVSCQYCSASPGQSQPVSPPGSPSRPVTRRKPRKPVSTVVQADMIKRKMTSTQDDQHGKAPGAGRRKQADPGPELNVPQTRSELMTELKSLKQQSKLSLRQIEERMLEVNSQKVLSRSTLARYLPSDGKEPAWPQRGDCLHTLVTVLCEKVGHPGDVARIMAAWERLNPIRNRSEHSNNVAQPAYEPIYTENLETAAETRSLAPWRLTRLAVVLGIIAIIALIVVAVAF
jgi:hypothetical protein